MSSIPQTTTRPEISGVLQKLRLKIQAYLFFHGVGLVLVALCAGFFLTLGFDWVHFQLRKLELPVWLRVLMALGMLAAVVWVLATQVILRLLTTKQSRSLALVLERRFPELNDRLITAVEMAPGRRPSETELTDAMLAETIAAVTHSTEELPLNAVFDPKPLVTAWAGAVVLLGAVGATAVAAPQAFERWNRAFLRFEDVYWLRQTRLEVFVLASPGDRERPFVAHEYKHPSGADLRLLVRVPQSERPGGKWVVPENVDIQYDFVESGSGDTKPLAKRGDREFQFKLSAVKEDLEFWVTGNDYINREPFKVVVVNPPLPEETALECDFPVYTGLNIETLKRVPLTSASVDIPVESFFLLDIKVNKPLRNAIVFAGPYEFSLGDFSDGELSSQSSASVREIDAAGNRGKARSLPDELAAQFLSPGGESIRLPFVMTEHPPEEVADRTHRIPAKYGAPWRLPPGAEFRVYLEDLDGIISADPVKFMVSGKTDQPPKVDTEKYGIGDSITAKASIPIKGIVTDDYGIEIAIFEFRVDDGQEFRKRSFHRPPENRPLEFRLQRADDEPFERFEVAPLDLTIGQQLTLFVYARDADDLNGPHETRGESRTFKIVTKEELIGILYERELNLRRQFEQIIAEIERTKKDLLDHRRISEDLDQLRVRISSGAATAGSAQQANSWAVDVINCADRSLHQIGKNRAETAAILESFRRILEELVNNRVQERQWNDRIRDDIIDPLARITNIDFPQADESIGLFHQDNEAGRDPKPSIDTSVETLNRMLVDMRAVLAEIEDLAEFHEALKDLEKLLEEQQNVYDATRKKQVEDVKEKLKGLGLDK